MYASLASFLSKAGIRPVLSQKERNTGEKNGYYYCRDLQALNKNTVVQSKTKDKRQTKTQQLRSGSKSFFFSCRDIKASAHWKKTGGGLLVFTPANCKQTDEVGGRASRLSLGCPRYQHFDIFTVIFMFWDLHRDMGWEQGVSRTRPNQRSLKEARLYDSSSSGFWATHTSCCRISASFGINWWSKTTVLTWKWLMLTRGWVWRYLRARRFSECCDLPQVLTWTCKENLIVPTVKCFALM